MSVVRFAIRIVCGIGLALVAVGPARAQNAAFGNFFRNVCGGQAASGPLGSFCSSSGGDLSPESESSLNPDQILGNSNEAIERVRQHQQLGARRLESLRANRRVAAAIDPQRPPGARAFVASESAPFPPDFAAADAAGSLFSTPVDGVAGLSLLLGARGSVFERDDSTAERGYDGFFTGGQIGADYRISERAVVGGFFGYERMESDFEQDPFPAPLVTSDASGSRESDSYFFSIFASYDWTDALHTDLNLGGGISDLSLERNVAFQPLAPPGSPLTLVDTRASTDGYEISAEAGVGYDVSLGSVQLGPYARLRYIRNDFDAYTEKGSSAFEMVFPSVASDSLASVLGVRESVAISTAYGVVVPEVRVEYEHEFLRDPIGATARFVNDPSGNVLALGGDAPDRNYANVGAGCVWLLPNGLIPYFDYEALLGFDDFERHRLSVGLRMEF
jgi:outer membrane autotransporter protein